MLAITICATKGYCYALPELFRAIQANLEDAEEEEGHLIFAGDQTAAEQARKARRFLPKKWAVHSLDAAKDRKKKDRLRAQLTIAALRTAAFTQARTLGVSECWSLDSDVLPPPEALRVMRDALSFDRGYYSVATCPYPSAKSKWLFGRGVPDPPFRQICLDVYEEERIIPEKLAVERAAFKEALRNEDITGPTTAEIIKKAYKKWNKKAMGFEKRLAACPAKGNVHTLNGIQWRKRGWGESAYPAIGRGSMVPTDWCGFGCTLLNQKALELVNFDGYDGKGTEDLYVVWRKWYPAGLRIAALPHAVCNHVVRTLKDASIKTTYTLMQASHELTGEAVGHLKIEPLPWK